MSKIFALGSYEAKHFALEGMLYAPLDGPCLERGGGLNVGLDLEPLILDADLEGMSTREARDASSEWSFSLAPALRFKTSEKTQLEFGPVWSLGASVETACEDGACETTLEQEEMIGAASTFRLHQLELGSLRIRELRLSEEIGQTETSGGEKLQHTFYQKTRLALKFPMGEGFSFKWEGAYRFQRYLDNDQADRHRFQTQLALEKDLSEAVGLTTGFVVEEEVGKRAQAAIMAGLKVRLSKEWELGIRFFLGPAEPISRR